MKATTLILSFSAFIALCLAAVGAMMLLAEAAQRTPTVAQAQATATASLTPSPQASQTTASSTPQVQPSATNTLRPAPTIEPPTNTPPPSPTAAPSATATLGVAVDLPNIRGLETDTPTPEQGCKPRSEWTLTYMVKEGDALARIAQAYGTYTNDLAEANCLTDPNTIRVGQTLKVPGQAHPETPQWVCEEWQVLTPMDRAFDIAETGQMTFNWRGSQGKRNLIRVFDADGNLFWERTVDMRQNETITLKSEGFTPGNYTWQVYPLDLNFQQIPCLESPLWHFNVGARASQDTGGETPTLP